jgi:hypothetical protein
MLIKPSLLRNRSVLVAAASPVVPSVVTEPTPVTLLTPQQAGLRLGVSAKALERWRSHAEGPDFVRLSRKVIRYRAQDIDGFVNGRVMTRDVG